LPAVETHGASGSIPQPHRTTIAEVSKAFLAKCENRAIADATFRKYKTFVKQLLAFCEHRGHVHLEQLSVAEMDLFYASWKDGPRAKAKKLDRLKAFVKFCRKRHWLTDDITEDLRAPQGSSLPAAKAPFTDDELTRIYAACDQLGGPVPPGAGHRPWGGEDAKDFIMLSIYTGLRISDVATFDIGKRLSGNDVFLRMHKTKKQLYTWIPDWLVVRLRDRERRKGPFIFRDGQSMLLRTVTEQWRRKLKKVFALAGSFDEPPTPHRFRHTFVRILLEKGVPVADVAELIGDKEEMVRQHYSKWIKSRQERLTGILKEAFAAKPKLVAIRR
jgi:integrase